VRCIKPRTSRSSRISAFPESISKSSSSCGVRLQKIARGINGTTRSAGRGRWHEKAQPMRSILRLQKVGVDPTCRADRRGRRSLAKVVNLRGRSGRGSRQYRSGAQWQRDYVVCLDCGFRGVIPAPAYPRLSLDSGRGRPPKATIGKSRSPQSNPRDRHLRCGAAISRGTKRSAGCSP
jgi:hypothetical protein